MQKSSYKILTIVGARPHFIKAVSVSQAIRKAAGVEEVMLHTGQHYDYQMSEAFFEELDLPKPKYNLEVGSTSPLQQMGKILLGLDKIFETEKPDLIIVYGDTNSTAAGAIAAAKSNIPLAHIEAGLREHDKRIPEEVNKLLCDAVADLYFCPTQTGVNNLKAAGVEQGVHLVGDVGIDLIHANSDLIQRAIPILKQHKLTPGNYFFMTCHRQANTDDPALLSEILSSLQALEMPILFAAHPRTRKAIEAFGLQEFLAADHIKACAPLGFWETQALVKNAKMVLTDSGGIIKEAYYHKVPAVILDTQSEWVETIEEGWNYLAGPDKQKILQRVHTFELPKVHSNCLGDGTASEQIVSIIKEYLDAEE